jgi:NAD(P)-dependent dehydrogenase (short-subunit alcohol dehydrogenase family)
MAAATGKVPGDDWTVVTGSNRGLGYGVAKRLVEQGRGVVMAARTQQSGRHLFPGHTAGQRLQQAVADSLC